ncbi:MAG TPA: tyrosinase family protein, partial [Candidatus Nitrosocosmicus sp.]|nr:tyrosinase family protein [Candidatus Nitrosocosmicus sp.]
PSLIGKFPQPTNRYDEYVMMHMLSFGEDENLTMIAHGSPTFLPWHRAYLRYIEREIQRIKPEYKDVTIPYWDWTSKKSTEAVWDIELMGGDGRESDWRVMDGKFAYDTGNWKLYTAESVNSSYKRPDLCRRFGYRKVDGVIRNPPTIPTADSVANTLKENPYDQPPWDGNSQPSFRNRLEVLLHNPVHVWVGGWDSTGDQINQCGAMSYGGSPNDPVFWLHHANIDRLWADWQLNQEHWIMEHKGYQPLSGGPVNMNVNDPMLPWHPTISITPARVANFYKIDSKGYKYVRYCRNTTKDREEQQQMDSSSEVTMIPPTAPPTAPPSAAPIADDSLLVNFDSIRSSGDDLVNILRKPLFPLLGDSL